MREMLAKRVVTDELRLDVEARQAELVDRQHGDLLFGQLIEQRDRRERMRRLLHGLVEHRCDLRQAGAAD
jgi:hypothetical protein